MRKFFWLPLVALTMLLVSTAGQAQTTAAQADSTTIGVRLVHAFAGAGEVDIYVNDNLVAPTVAFTDATPHLNVPTGTHSVAIRPAGADSGDAPILSQTIIAEEPRPGVVLSLIVQPDASSNPALVISEDDLNPAQLGQARLHFVHAIPEAPPVNVFTSNGGTIAPGVTFGEENRTIDPPVNVYDLVVSAGDSPADSIFDIGAVEVNTGLLYKFIIAGSVDAPQVIQLATPLNSADPAATVLTRIAHGSPDAPAVDVYANDVKVLVNLEPGDLTPHVALPSTDITLAVRQAGAAPNSEAATTANINLSSSTGAASLVAVGSLADDTFTFSVFEDRVAGLAASDARIRVLNTVTAGPADVTLADTPVASGLQVFSASTEVDVEAGIYSVSAIIESAGAPLSFDAPAQPFVGGSYYTLLLFANATAGLSVSNTPLAPNLSSLPGAVIAEPVVAATDDTTSAPPADTTTTTDATDTTDTSAPPADTTTTTDTTAPPAADTTTTTTTTTTTAPPASPPGGTPPRQGIDRTLRGQVNLNPGVNLQCREYPSADARSLGLVPNNTVMEIVGYAAAADPEVNIPFIPVDDENIAIYESLPRGEVVTNDAGDRVYVAGEYDDLEFEDIWLSALWTTPEGTVLDCWARADLLLLTYQDEFINEVDEFFGLQRFIELPRPVISPIPYNYAAAPVDVETAVTTPDTTAIDPTTQGPVVDRRALPIVGIVDVAGNNNLQCREYPSPTARSLGLIQNNTQLQVVGFAGPADPEITTPFIPVDDESIAVFETLPPETETEFEALDFNDIWLSALFTPSDGNTIDCWVRLDFLTLIYRDEFVDDLERLFTLDDPDDAFDIFIAVPYNAPAAIVAVDEAPSTPGTGAGPGTGDTGASAPPASGSSVTGTVNIPQGSNLNMFETPSINGVQIRSLTSGATVEVLGRTADNAWLQVRFEALGEGTFVGWVSNVGNWIEIPVDVNTLPITG